MVKWICSTREVIVGLIKQTVDKTKKNEATGIYVKPQGKHVTRMRSTRSSVPRITTTAELRSSEEAVFTTTWNRAGKTRISYKQVYWVPSQPKLLKKPTTSFVRLSSMGWLCRVEPRVVSA